MGEDGHPERGGFLPPVPLPRRMWAGSDVRFIEPLRIGQTIERKSTISNVETKSGKTGMLCFVTVDHRWTADGRLAIKEKQDIVYRDSPAEGDPRNTVTAAAVDDTPPGKTVDPTETLLFRYSALMFNSHRIHYDRDYAVGTEGYPSLVVQGPMQATFLARHAQEVGNSRLARFRFRSMSPLFDNAPIGLHHRQTDEGHVFWTGSGSRVGTRAVVEYR